jgi:MscS family membrane protein
MLLSYSAALSVLGLVCAHGAAWAQANAPKQPPSPSVSSAADETNVEDSPRSALEDFFQLAHSGRYAAAAKYLELPAGDSRGPQLVARLTAVLDRYAWADRDTASAAPGGDADDGLPPGVDEVGKIPGPDGELEPVRLVRRRSGEARWVFSRVTTQRIDGWYEAMPHRWLIEFAPEPLLRMGPSNLLWAQWCALPLFILLAWSLGSLLSRLGWRVIDPWVERTQSTWDNALRVQLARPITFGCRLLIAYALVPLLGLYAPGATFAIRSIRALLLATFFWGLARTVDVAGQTFAASHWGKDEPATRALLLFTSRFGKIVVASFAVVMLFSELGYQVTSLIAGLGLGGVAVALAAQKSVENLIGAFAIVVDQPFREGDLVRVDGCVGHVEVIGMRSTRIRTLDRTLISFPNGKLADMRVETYAARDRIRWAFTFGVTYQTSQAQLRAIIAESEALLRKHPKIWPQDVSVRFKEFGDSGLLLEVAAWFEVQDNNAFAVIRQELLLDLMVVVERTGARFALPTRVLEIEESKRGPQPNSAADPPSQSPP